MHSPERDLSKPNHVLQSRVADAFCAHVGHFDRRLAYLEPTVDVAEQGLVRLLPGPIVTESISLTSATREERNGRKESKHNSG
jgi:hypothetical protein